MARKSKLKEKWVVLAVVVFISLSAVGFGTGYFQFFAAHVKCGKPPIIVQPGSSFAGGYSSYYYTKDDGFHYKPAWDKYYFCSEKEARQNDIKPGGF